MRVYFVVFVVAVVTSFVGRGNCQLDCAFPNETDVISVMQLSLLNGENVNPPTIDILRSRLVCLTYGRERDRFIGFSILVEYMCDNFGDCPSGSVTEQFEGACQADMGTWTNDVSGSRQTRTLSPVATFDTVLREDCGLCISPSAASSVGVPAGRAPDDDNHCVACANACGNNGGQIACFDTTGGDCCNFYDDQDLCTTECPPFGFFDDSTFQCVNSCRGSDLRNTGNGAVSYSTIGVSDNYAAGTVATLECNPGFIGGLINTDTCLNSGNWTSNIQPCSEINLPPCGDPPPVTNAEIANPLPIWPIGSTATYQCIEGYYFAEDSESSIECTDLEGTGVWPRTDNIKCVKCEDLFPGCEVCDIGDDGKVRCIDCERNFELRDDNCEKITGGGEDDGLCIPCIVVPIAVILAIILAIIVALIIYAIYKRRKSAPINLNKKDPEGINGVARDNPLYLDPSTVAADEGEE